MKLVITDVGAANVISVRGDGEIRSVPANPAYEGAALWLTDQEVYEGYAPPDGMTSVSRDDATTWPPPEHA